MINQNLNFRNNLSERLRGKSSSLCKQSSSLLLVKEKMQSMKLLFHRNFGVQIYQNWLSKTVGAILEKKIINLR